MVVVPVVMVIMVVVLAVVVEIVALMSDDSQGPGIGPSLIVFASFAIKKNM